MTQITSRKKQGQRLRRLIRATPCNVPVTITAHSGARYGGFIDSLYSDTTGSTVLLHSDSGWHSHRVADIAKLSRGKQVRNDTGLPTDLYVDIAMGPVDHNHQVHGAVVWMMPGTREFSATQMHGTADNILLHAVEQVLCHVVRPTRVHVNHPMLAAVFMEPERFDASVRGRAHNLRAQAAAQQVTFHMNSPMPKLPFCGSPWRTLDGSPAKRALESGFDTGGPTIPATARLVYTDGSFDPIAGVGAASWSARYMQASGSTVKTGAWGNSTEVELAAIDLAVREHLIDSPDVSRLTILTDCKSIADPVTHGSMNGSNRAIRESIERLSPHVTSGRLRLQWVRAHIGVPGNEIVDSMSRALMQQQRTSNVLYLSDYPQVPEPRELVVNQ